jgi:hypothetical protein
MEAGLRMRATNRAAVATTALLALAGLGLGLWPLPQAKAQAGLEEKAPPALPGDNPAPVPVHRHKPVRLRVHPLAQTLGPDSVRQCVSWLATEYRPSGTVIVPRMRCWWEHG